MSSPGNRAVDSMLSACGFDREKERAGHELNYRQFRKMAALHLRIALQCARSAFRAWCLK